MTTVASTRTIAFTQSEMCSWLNDTARVFAGRADTKRGQEYHAAVQWVHLNHAYEFGVYAKTEVDALAQLSYCIATFTSSPFFAR